MGSFGYVKGKARRNQRGISDLIVGIRRGGGRIGLADMRADIGELLPFISHAKSMKFSFKGFNWLIDIRLFLLE